MLAFFLPDHLLKRGGGPITSKPFSRSNETLSRSLATSEGSTESALNKSSLWLFDEVEFYPFILAINDVCYYRALPYLDL